jgi:hypothetical protein
MDKPQLIAARLRLGSDRADGQLAALEIDRNEKGRRLGVLLGRDNILSPLVGVNLGGEHCQ